METERDVISAEIPPLRPETIILEHSNDVDEQIAIQHSPCATQQLAAGTLAIFEPPLVTVRMQLKELIAKQNKIYVDLLAEKFQLDNADISKLNDMMYNVKLYRDKLVKIKKRMQNIYQRARDLKKKSANIQAYKQKELQRKQLKEQHEEALIGSK